MFTEILALFVFKRIKTINIHVPRNYNYSLKKEEKYTADLYKKNIMF